MADTKTLGKATAALGLSLAAAAALGLYAVAHKTPASTNNNSVSIVLRDSHGNIVDQN